MLSIGRMAVPSKGRQLRIPHLDESCLTIHLKLTKEFSWRIFALFSPWPKSRYGHNLFCMNSFSHSFDSVQSNCCDSDFSPQIAHSKFDTFLQTFHDILPSLGVTDYRKFTAGNALYNSSTFVYEAIFAISEVCCQILIHFSDCVI